MNYQSKGFAMWSVKNYVIISFFSISTIGTFEVVGGESEKKINCYEAQQGVVPPQPNTIDSTCAEIPKDILGSGDTQTNADQYSWLTFIALNWPVNSMSCTGDATGSIFTKNTTPTWLSYLTNDEVFVASGKPASWCPQQGTSQVQDVLRNKRMENLSAPEYKLAKENPDVSLFLKQTGKSRSRLSAIKASLKTDSSDFMGILQTSGEPLVDQNGRFVRYSVHINKQEYEHITTLKLWTKAGQEEAGDITFPHSTKETNGAIEIKAAWKVLGKGDDHSRFFTQKAIVYNDGSGELSPGPNPVTVGLVGLHIAQKTERQPKWLWSTFAQVDNNTRSFFNPHCSVTNCPHNKPTATKPFKELDAKGKPLNKPAQVVQHGNPPTNELMNETFQKLLSGTPWEHYQLVSTQWEGGFGNQPKPGILGNTVLETFVQKTQPYSCIGCHSQATDFPAGNKSDFSFIINALQ